MMYPYMTLSDETEIVHSQIIEKDGVDTIQVHFERPTDDGLIQRGVNCQITIGYTTKDSPMTRLPSLPTF